MASLFINPLFLSGDMERYEWIWPDLDALSKVRSGPWVVWGVLYHWYLLVYSLWFFSNQQPFPYSLVPGTYSNSSLWDRGLNTFLNTPIYLGMKSLLLLLGLLGIDKLFNNPTQMLYLGLFICSCSFPLGELPTKFYACILQTPDICMPCSLCLPCRNYYVHIPEVQGWKDIFPILKGLSFQ